MFLPKLYRAIVLKKYKMFFVDAVLEETGEIITAYTKNKGGFVKEMAKGKFIYVSHHPDPNRKTKYSVELIDNQGLLSGVDPNLGVKLLSEYLLENKDLKILKKEVTVEDSRLDLRLSFKDQEGFGEIKSVFTYEGEVARFPEAITERGQKHVKLLTKLVKEKTPAYLFYIVHIPHVTHLKICTDIDPVYGKLMIEAIKSGVKVIALKCKVSQKEISILQEIPVVI